MSVKRAYFTDKFGLGGYLNNLSSPAVAYQRPEIAGDVIIDKSLDGGLHPEPPVERRDGRDIDPLLVRVCEAKLRLQRQIILKRQDGKHGR